MRKWAEDESVEKRQENKLDKMKSSPMNATHDIEMIIWKKQSTLLHRTKMNGIKICVDLFAQRFHLILPQA